MAGTSKNSDRVGSLSTLCPIRSKPAGIGPFTCSDSLALHKTIQTGKKMFLSLTVQTGKKMFLSLPSV